MPTRNNRLWLPEYAWVQATFALCEKCGEAYEADREHVCRKRNSYPTQPKTMRVAMRPMEVSVDDTKDN